MKYGYARVSTRHQDLEGQMRQLEEEHCDQIFLKKLLEQKAIV